MKRQFFILILSACTAWAGDWPQWLGPTRNNRVAADEKNLDKLPADLKPVWKISAGGGFSSPVVSSNRLFYFDENGQKEVVHGIDASTGKELWQAPIAERYADEWGAGPRSTPFVDGDRVYVQSCNGEFRCLNVADGKVIWGTSFEKDFGVKFLGSKAAEGTASRRGHNGSGMVDGDAVVLPVGSINGATLVCFDKLSGKIIWKSGTDETAYSSLQIATVGGVRQVIVLAADALVSVDRANGQPLWRIPLTTYAKRHAATPVISGDNIFVNSHTFGLLSLLITREGAGWKTATRWENKNLMINLSTPVIEGNSLYSQGPGKDFICADTKSGELKWSQPGFGKINASTIVVGGKLLFVTDTGELVLIAASAEKYTELGRAQVCGKTWNFPAYANGKIYLRDSRELICYDLSKG